MSAPPGCESLGRQCQALDVLLRIGSLEEGATSLDHEATWLLGHTERITFGEVWTGEGELYVDAVLHVPCRHLKGSADGRSRCAAHGFEGRTPRAPRAAGAAEAAGTGPLPGGGPDEDGQPAFPAPAAVASRCSRVASANPCEGAPCETSDHKRGAACCRDLQVEIMCTRKQLFLEALIRHRKSPYLCKVGREGDFSIDVEMISACGFIEDGRGGLHPPWTEPGRRADRQAGPLLRMAAQGQGIAPRMRVPGPETGQKGRLAAGGRAAGAHFRGGRKCASSSRADVYAVIEPEISLVGAGSRWRA